jgi:Ribonuclease G/E
MAVPDEDRGPVDEIDMDRIVTDREYRQQVITRLRRDRMRAEAERPTEFEALLAAAGADED